MPMSLEEISDRMEIQDLLVAYSYAIDTRDWDALDRVFTPDAWIDYTEFGGSAGNLEDTKKFLAEAMLISLIGGVIGYAIGAGAWHLLQDWFFVWVPGVTPEAFARVQGLYDRWDFWAVFVAGLTPIPYKVFTVAAGVFDVSLATLVAASAIGRPARFFAVAAVFFFFGRQMRELIERYFDLLTWALLVLGIAGFVVIRFLD